MWIGQNFIQTDLEEIFVLQIINAILGVLQLLFIYLLLLLFWHVSLRGRWKFELVTSASLGTVSADWTTLENNISLF